MQLKPLSKIMQVFVHTTSQNRVQCIVSVTFLASKDKAIRSANQIEKNIRVSFHLEQNESIIEGMFPSKRFPPDRILKL